MSSKKNRKSKLEDSDSDSGPDDVSKNAILYFKGIAKLFIWIF